jgi:hypothetical protein
MNKLDDQNYHKCCGPQNLNSALTTLKGIVIEIATEGKIESREVKKLGNWCSENASYRKLNPFNELLPIIDEALTDGAIERDELEAINWFLEGALSQNSIYNAIAGDLQYLQGLIHGILSDGLIKEEEIESLKNWLTENEHLSGCYPYDEIYSIIFNALADGKFNEEESETLNAFFAEFACLSLENQIRIDSELKNEVSTLGVCAVEPVIQFKDKVFCFTGQSVRVNRSELTIMIEAVGGIFSRNFTDDVNYLIYGAEGNQCWAFSCYGRIVEKAMELRKKGDHVLIIHENDFWNSYEDESVLNRFSQ